MKTPNKNDMFDGIITKHTREEAINNGSLIDITDTALQTGIAFPTAITRKAWDYMINNEPNMSDIDINKKTEIVCILLVIGIKRQLTHTKRITYPITRKLNGVQEETFLRAVLSGGDNGEAVLTIMLPDEDKHEKGERLNMNKIDKFEKAIHLMEKWNSDDGATNEELLELETCLKDVGAQLNSALEDRLNIDRSPKIVMVTDEDTDLPFGVYDITNMTGVMKGYYDDDYTRTMYSDYEDDMLKRGAVKIPYTTFEV